MRITRRPSTAGIAPLDDAATIAPPPAFMPPPPRTAATGAAGDSVELSDGARLRQRLHADVGDVAENDTSRITSLRARVAAGYRPDAGAVAQSLVGELAADLVV